MSFVAKKLIVHHIPKRLQQKVLHLRAVKRPCKSYWKAAKWAYLLNTLNNWNLENCLLVLVHRIWAHLTSLMLPALHYCRDSGMSDIHHYGLKDWQGVTCNLTTRCKRHTEKQKMYFSQFGLAHQMYRWLWVQTKILLHQQIHYATAYYFVAIQTSTW